MWVVLVFLLYFILERIIIMAARKRIKTVIHVNGIRGKSSICRILDSGFRNAGYRTLTKTTGSAAEWIDVNGQVKKVRRNGRANIHEQIMILVKAAWCKADVLIVECMAIQPKLQWISEHLILQSDIVIISNIRMDHMETMGSNILDISKALSQTLPINGHLYIPRSDLNEVIQAQADITNTTIHSVAINAMGFEASVCLSKMVLEEFCVAKDGIQTFLKEVQLDIGQAIEVELGNKSLFINGFAMNDAQSTDEFVSFKRKVHIEKELCLIWNVRSDRPIRIDQFVNLIVNICPDEVFIMGDALPHISYKLLRKGVRVNCISAKIAKVILDKSENKLFIGIGNMKGEGIKLLDMVTECS